MLDAFALEPLADQRVDRMSMGQRQRVRLAAAFLHDPDAILLDEPGTSLGEDGLDLLANEIRRVREAGRSVLWCVPTGASDLVDSDRILKLEDARLVAA
jgi:ABC-type multidrug transport system ATPase subunit